MPDNSALFCLIFFSILLRNGTRYCIFPPCQPQFPLSVFPEYFTLCEAIQQKQQFPPFDVYIQTMAYERAILASLFHPHGFFLHD